MPLEFQCPYCGQVLSAPDEAAGVTGTCRFCQAAVVAPAFPGQPAELAQPGDPNWFAASPSQPTGVVNPGSIVAESWSILWSNLGTILGAYWGAIGITVFATLPFMLAVMWPWLRSLPEADPSTATMPPGMIIGLLVLSLIASPMMAGPYFVIDRLIARGDPDLRAIFAGLRQYRALLTFSVIFSAPQWVFTFAQMATQNSNPALALLLSILGNVVAVTMWVVFGIGLIEIVDRGVEPIDALRTSWEVTQGKRLSILATFILLTLIGIAGMLACCVGVFVTGPIILVGQVLIYRHLRGLQGTRV